MRRSLLALALILISTPAVAQQWDQVNGSMQVKSGPSAPLVIIDQTNAAANRKILSLRAAGTEKCSIDIDGDLVCAGSFSFVNMVFTGQAQGPVGNCTTAPAYSFTGDANNGWSSPSADAQCWVISGANVMGLAASALTVATTYNIGWSDAQLTRVAGDLLGLVAGDELIALDGAFYAQNDNIVTTSTDGFIARNEQAATVGVPVQISTRARYKGTGWDVDDVVSRSVSFFTETLPVSGNTVSGTFKVGFIDPVSSAITYPFTVSSAGVANALSGLQINGVNVPVAVAAGYKIARGSASLDASNPTTVATGLTTVVSCTGTLLRNTALTTGTAFLTHDAASGANVDWYAWVVAGTASTGTEVFEWICVGT